MFFQQKYSKYNWTSYRRVEKILLVGLRVLVWEGEAINKSVNKVVNKHNSN